MRGHFQSAPYPGFQTPFSDSAMEKPRLCDILSHPEAINFSSGDFLMSHQTQKRDLANYWRLLGYAKPYKWRLAVGILAGFIASSSLLGGLLMIPYLMRGVDPNKPENVAAAEKTAAEIVLAMDRSPHALSRPLEERISPKRKKSRPSARFCWRRIHTANWKRN